MFDIFSLIKSDEFIVTVVGGLVVGLLLKFFYNSDNNQHSKSDSSNIVNATSSPTVNPTISPVVNSTISPVINFLSNPETHETRSKNKSMESTTPDDIAEFKKKLTVLFIDDKIFKKISNLKKAGWTVIQLPDVDSLHQDEIQNANIIFVDYKDVGKKLSKEEGLGIVKGLKSRYGESKWIIFYSAHPQSLNVHNSGADAYIAKNSNMLEMEQKIIEGARNLSK